MLTAQNYLRDEPAEEHPADDMPSPVYFTLDDGDELGAEEEGSLTTVWRAAARNDDVHFIQLESPRTLRTPSSNEQGVAQIIGVTRRCLASSVEQLDVSTESAQSDPRSRKFLSKKAKLYIICLAFACLVLLVYSHLNNAKASILSEELERLKSSNKDLVEKTQLVESEKQDLANLLLDEDAKWRMQNLITRSKRFNEFIASYGFDSNISNTKSVRRCLGDAMVSLNVASMLDIPCGDGSWQYLIPGLDKVAYVGADLSPTALERAKQRQRNAASDMQFMLFDACQFPLRRAFDLIVFRDIVEQQRLQDTLEAMLNFKKSGSEFIAATYWPNSTEEQNAKGWRLPSMWDHASMYEPNLMLEPFNFPQPLFSCDNVDEDSQFRGLSKLGFWRLRDLPVTQAKLTEVNRHTQMLDKRAGQRKWQRRKDEQERQQQQQQQQQQPEVQNISVDKLMQFFGGALNPHRRPGRGYHRRNATGANVASLQPLSPFDGLLNDWLERPGPVLAEPHPLTGVARSPDFITHFFRIPMFEAEGASR